MSDVLLLKAYQAPAAMGIGQRNSAELERQFEALEARSPQFCAWLSDLSPLETARLWATRDRNGAACIMLDCMHTIGRLSPDAAVAGLAGGSPQQMEKNQTGRPTPTPACLPFS